MEDQSQVSVDNQSSIPTLNDLQSQQIGGLVSPFSIEPSKLDLPQPPKPYPVGVSPSNLIPTQKGLDDYDKMFNGIVQQYSDTSWANDTLKYSQAESYNADYDGANFERYYKVPSVFKEKGFSPYRDNEKIYDENATWFDYYKRSFGAMGDGFVSGFTDMLPWNSWSSDVTDIEAARNMERAHAIGADNRGGFGSFMNNMTVDFGYTGGILAEFAAEELVMWAGAALAAPESGGASLVAAGAEATMQAGKLGKLFKKAMDLKTYAKGLAKTQDWIRNADKMRDIYSVAKSGATKLGKALVPETLKYADEMAQLGRKGDLVFDMAKTAKGFGALYRDARRVSASVSESAMEGGSAELEVRNRLADEIYATGRAPSQEEWTDIYAKAANAGRETFWWNLPVLYASNAIVFEKAFKGFKPLEAFKEELSSGLKGKLTYNQAWKAANKKAWEVVDKSFMDSVKALGSLQTYKPKNLITSAISKFANYTQANLAEGFQEVYQDAVQKTMTDYYTNQFYHPAVAGARSTWGAFADNVGMLNPFGESSDTFLSGFLMGSMATVPQKAVFEWMPKKFHQYTDPEGYAEYQRNLERHTNSVVDALNAATMDEKFFDNITVNASQQFNNKKEAELANMAGDKRAFYTITDNAVAEHMHTLISTGKINLIKDHLADLKQLKPSELQEAFGPIDKSQGDPETFYQNKIQAMEDKIDLVEKHTERIEKRFPNPFNPAGVSKKNDPEGHEKELNRYKGFEMAKKAAIMSSYNFDRAVERIQSITNKLLKDYDTIWQGPNMKFTQTMANASATNLGNILNVNSIDATIDVLKSEVETYSKGDAESQKKAEASKANLEDLQDLRAAINEVQILSFTSKEEDANPDSTKAADAKKASKVVKGTKVLNKKGEAVTVDKVKGGYAYDKAGNRIGKSKNLEVVGGEQGSEDYLNMAGQNLYNAYSKYIKNVAKRSGLTVHQNAIDETFQEYKDIFLLGTDMQEYADFVDILHNPKGLVEYASRTAQVLQTIKEQKRELLEKAYKEFFDSKTLNQFFTKLYEKGIFLDEEGMKNVLNKKLPDTFYKIKGMVPIEEGDPLVDEIEKIIEQYEQTQGFVFEGRKKAEPETPETTPAATATTTTTTTTTPVAETGPITKETSIERLRTVGLLPSLVTAFRDFVNNAYDTGNLEVLSRLNPRFNNITKEQFNANTDDQLASLNAFKTYLSYSNPGRMMAEYNRKAGLVTTPAPAPAATTTGETKPEDIKANAKYKGIVNGLPATISVTFITDKGPYKGNATVNVTYDDNRGGFGGNSTVEEIASWINAKPTTTTATPIDWNSLIANAVSEKELDAVMDQIDNQGVMTPELMTSINQKRDTFKKPAEPTTTTTGFVPREVEARLDLVSKFGMDQAVVDKMTTDEVLAEYDKRSKAPVSTDAKADIEKKISNIESQIQSLNYFIAGTDSYDATIRAERDIKMYEEDLKKLKEELAALEGEPIEEETQREKITTDQKKDLKALGFSARDYASFSKKEAQDIIDENLTKQERLERDEQLAAEEIAKREAEKEESSKEKETRVRKMIEDAEFLDDFKDIDAEISLIIATDPFFNTAELEFLIQKRKETLAENPIFEDIKVNETIQLNNKGKYIVLKKTGKNIEVRKANDITAKPFKINIKQFDKSTRDTTKSYVTMRVQPGMEIVSAEPTVTPEDRETINKNFKDASAFTDSEELKEDIALGKKLSAAERRNNIINNIKSCGL